MANVDPFVIQWPKKWVEDPELRDVLQYLNRFLHDLWIKTGGGEDAISDLAAIGLSAAMVAKLQQQVGSGQFLTCDDTGFSCDSTEFTTDMTEA